MCVILHCRATNSSLNAISSCCGSVSYPLSDMDLQQDVPVVVAVIDLQHHVVLHMLRAVMEVLDLLPGQLLQLEPTQCTIATETGQPSVTWRHEDHDQDFSGVVRVFNMQNQLRNCSWAAAAPHGQRSKRHHPGGLRVHRADKGDLSVSPDRCDFNRHETKSHLEFRNQITWSRLWRTRKRVAAGLLKFI